MNNDQIKEQIGIIKHSLNYIAVSIIGVTGWLFINLNSSEPQQVLIAIPLLICFVFLYLFTRFLVHELIKKITG